MEEVNEGIKGIGIGGFILDTVKILLIPVILVALLDGLLKGIPCGGSFLAWLNKFRLRLDGNRLLNGLLGRGCGLGGTLFSVLLHAHSLLVFFALPAKLVIIHFRNIISGVAHSVTAFHCTYTQYMLSIQFQL